MKKIILVLVATFVWFSQGHSQIQLTETNLKIGSSTQQAPAISVEGSSMNLLTPGSFALEANSILQKSEYQIKSELYPMVSLCFFTQKNHKDFFVTKQAVENAIQLINEPNIDTCLINGDDGVPCTTFGVTHINDEYFSYLTPNSPYSISLGSSKNPFRNVFAKQYYATGSTSILASSDARMKTNIRKLTYGLDAVLVMNPAIFDFIPQDIGGVADSIGKNKIGFIAQEMKEIVPEVVEYLPQSDRYAMDYGALIPVLVKAIQEQQAMIETLMNRVKKLEEK